MPGDAIIMKICGRISALALPVFLTISGSYDVRRLFKDFHICILECLTQNVEYTDTLYAIDFNLSLQNS